MNLKDGEGITRCEKCGAALKGIRCGILEDHNLYVVCEDCARKERWSK